MPEELILHIGTHKTGTSALQWFFYHNSALLDKNGIYYPHTGNEVGLAQHWLVSSIMGNRNPRHSTSKSFTAYIDDLIIETREKAKVLISSEMLCKCNDFDQLELFKKVADSIKIVVYLRRQDLFFESCFMQVVKNGGANGSFDAYLEDRMQISKDYYNLVNKWASLFGKENIIVRPYEKRQFIGGSIFSDFMNVLGHDLDDEYIFPDSLTNPTLCRDCFNFQLKCNALPLHRQDKTYIGQALKRYSGKFHRNGGWRDIIPPARKIEIIEYYQNSNSRIAREYLGRDDGVLFMDPLPEINKKFPEYHGLSRDNIVKIGCFIAQQHPSLFCVLVKEINAGLQSEDKHIQQAAECLNPVCSIVSGSMLKIEMLHEKAMTLLRMLIPVRVRYYLKGIFYGRSKWQ